MRSWMVDQSHFGIAGIWENRKDPRGADELVRWRGQHRRRSLPGDRVRLFASLRSLPFVEGMETGPTGYAGCVASA